MKNHAYIYLSENPPIYATIDESDYTALNLHLWHITPHPTTGLDFATRLDESGNTLYMHRQLLGLAHDDPRQCRHRGTDTLDNRRSQLVLDRDYAAEALITEGLAKQGKRGPKGYHWNRQRGKYFATIWVRDVKKHLGTYNSPLDARKAWQKAGREAWQEKRNTATPRPFPILRRLDPR